MDMHRTRIIVIVLLSFVQALTGQKASEGDRLYYEYNYQQAIDAYMREAQKSPLVPEQRLNLAESYFKTRQYTRASELYMELYKADSLMSNHHFNSMLQALSKSSGRERVNAFLNTRRGSLSDELMENAEFNEAVLGGETPSASYELFILNSNSAQADFSPSFLGEDRLLFSSSRPQEDKEVYGPSGESYLDIYVSTLDERGQARNPEALEWLPKLIYHEATPYYSPELDGVFYVRSNAEGNRMTFDENGKNSLAVGLARRDGDFMLLLRDPSTSFYYPYYDAFNQRLYFAADFEEGYGGTDLYYVSTNEGRIMSAPVNLGPRINSPGNEIAPYILDGSLYFASDVFYGQGGMDLYKSQMRAEGAFSIPVNLGPDINTRYDEFGLILRLEESGEYSGYFASNRPGGLGNDDIYGFRATETPGLRTRVFQGVVLDSRGNPLEKAEIRVTDAGGQVVKTVYSQENGRFYAELPWQEDLSLTLSKERYGTVNYGVEQALDISSSNELLEVSLASLDNVIRERNGRPLIRADRFLFARGSAQLSPQIREVLDEVVGTLKGFPRIKLRIEAHTDSRGSARTNLRLSEQRATAIREYLIGQGIAAERLVEIEGLGESQIMNNCKDGVYCLEMLHQQNERYPLVVLNYKELVGD